MLTDAMSEQEYFAANRELWNKRTPIHLKSQFYDVASFKRGQTSLCGIEQQALGKIAGKSLLHLQCHFGQDTLSLARLGAKVTGVDFSEAAIVAARGLADELDLKATFLCENIYDLSGKLDQPFDIVYTSFGVLGWLPDLDRWAALIHQCLKPGGVFYLLEFHPFYTQFNDDGDIEYPYFAGDGPSAEISTTSYTDGKSHEPQQEYWWDHTLSDTINALREHQLNIVLFREFPYSVYRLGEGMVQLEPGKWVNSKLQDRIPYMFSIKAVKSEADRCG